MVSSASDAEASSATVYIALSPGMRTFMSLYDTYFVEFLIWRITQFYISVLGNTADADIVDDNPVRSSAQAIRISSTPRFLMLFGAEAQNLALSFSPARMPRESLCP